MIDIASKKISEIPATCLYEIAFLIEGKFVIIMWTYIYVCFAVRDLLWQLKIWHSFSLYTVIFRG